MPKHYVYRMDHDVGFAPRIQGCLCTLCGCKTTTVERWAEPGSWVVGIGGLGTGRPDALIYAMRVDSTPSYHALSRGQHHVAAYLRGHGIVQNAHVLLAYYFFYFGENVLLLPPHLKHIVIDRQGAWRLTDPDVEALQRFLGPYGPGKHGEPNNGRKCRSQRQPRHACFRTTV